mmetsp:Transcript_68777/g.222205  ORF Transcript_68777/g.222205 Transcript_68777/m.222205 type:complete len:209 (+) Transcript_68777:1287-1913(+)
MREEGASRLAQRAARGGRRGEGVKRSGLAQRVDDAVLRGQRSTDRDHKLTSIVVEQHGKRGCGLQSVALPSSPEELSSAADCGHCAAERVALPEAAIVPVNRPPAGAAATRPRPRGTGAGRRPRARDGPAARQSEAVRQDDGRAAPRGVAYDAEPAAVDPVGKSCQADEVLQHSPVSRAAWVKRLSRGGRLGATAPAMGLAKPHQDEP